MPTATSKTAVHKPTPIDDPVFDGYVASMQDRLTGLLAHPKAMLYTTDATGLFDLYLKAFPASTRQHFNCSACKSFLEAYGGLVVIDDAGIAQPALWDATQAHRPYKFPVTKLTERVRQAQVTGVFYSAGAALGTQMSGGWTHLAVTLPSSYVRLHGSARTPDQAMAEKREDFKNVNRALADFNQLDLDHAVQILGSETLYRSEQLLGAAEWLQELQRIRNARSIRPVKHNRLWRAVALAPAGFCHPRSGMIGTLLEDLERGLEFEDVKRRFNEKMDPLHYQRPQAAPTAGAIATAERLVTQMGIEASLRRRYARLDEIESMWRPHSSRPFQGTAGSGVFGHLTPKQVKPTQAFDLGPVVMTWEKFKRIMLPTANRIEFYVPREKASYCQLTTATDPMAPPILQWDGTERRNPVAWYVYHGGSYPHQFGLAGGYVDVTSIAAQPSMWHGRAPDHHGESVLFCLDNCRDLISGAAGLALFPEFLKSELHGVRSVIEAHSNQGRMDPTDGPIAAGYRLSKGSNQHARLRVTSGIGVRTVTIDRWD